MYSRPDAIQYATERCRGLQCRADTGSPQPHFSAREILGAGVIHTVNLKECSSVNATSDEHKDELSRNFY